MKGRPRRALRWLMVLFIAGASVLIGASARAQTTRPCVIGHSCPATTTTTSTVVSTGPSSSVSSPTSVPTGGQRTLYTGTFTPCTSDGTQDGSEPCDETPVSIQVSYPTNSPPDQVQVSWDASGRNAAAPDPDTTSVTLTAAQGSSCGTDLICWAWPAAMDDGSYVLNGTYDLAICPFGDAPHGQCDDPLAAQYPSAVGLAVPPGAPTAVAAQAAGTEVTVSWKPPTQVPPDLVGYTVARGNATVYTCSTDDLGPGSSTPCPTILEVADHPGDGEYTYSVSALRLGVDDASANVVSSTSAVDGQGVVTVPGPTTPVPGGGSGVGGTRVPLSGSGGGSGAQVPIAGSSSITGTQVTLGQVSAPAQPAAGSPPVPKLSYPTASGIAPTHPQALDLKVDPPAPHDDVVPVAVLALGILSLAVAAHFLYLRVELGVVQARLSARRTSGV